MYGPRGPDTAMPASSVQQQVSGTLYPHLQDHPKRTRSNLGTDEYKTSLLGTDM
jgi:hypothetical protein